MRSSLVTCLALGVATSMAQTASILIFSATTGFRHDSIPTAIAALQAAGPAHNATFNDTEDSTQFNDDNLANYDAVLFLMVTDISPDDILDSQQQQAFQNYLNKGGNFVAIHAASDCLHDVDFYGKEVGAYFLDHPTISEATFLNNIDPTNPIVSMIPAQWTYTEEVYDFKSDPRSVGAKVILTVDQPAGDPDAGIQGSPHPIAWYQERGAGVSQDAQLAGRSFYTSLGHLNSTWQDPIFMGHVMGGIMYTLQGNTTRAFNSSALVGKTTSAPSHQPTRRSNGAGRSSSLLQGAVMAAVLAPIALFRSL